ncbi:DUF547 domain-containing protein [Simiduia sp. 21SJ11W-1]|uniref:DUF547 domain-containing protein n=1 Tax=Simiduia sp. 21SJ11W-1 TaxID=2909669 RepID=UPI00209D3964|nr:DUF547 domain-containing protein [Simiduia sp. 21SJ11W-1]UTA49424.1 DUF547 domain-containing protein [Simiduia sp. 21SJ11W-1]
MNLKRGVYVACLFRTSRAQAVAVICSLSMLLASAFAGAAEANPYQQFLDTYRHETPRGALVDYRAVTDAHKKALGNYVAGLQRQAPSTMGGAEAQAYWVNLYNSRMILLVLESGIPASIKDVKPNLAAWLAGGPWKYPVVDVEGRSLSFDDIEHGILRAQWQEPRIHFVLNCASIGCPDLPAKVLTAGTLEAQLESAAWAFINSEKGVDVSANTVYLSRIFYWFGEDFGTTEGARIAFINGYRKVPIPEGASLRYRYDWALNDYQAAR